MAEVIIAGEGGGREIDDPAGTDAGGNGRRAEGSSLISRMVSSSTSGLAWLTDKVKAPNFSNSAKKSSRKEDGIGTKLFAAGHPFVRDSHSWDFPGNSPSSEPGDILWVEGRASSLEANLERSRVYEVGKMSKENNNNQNRQTQERCGSEHKTFFILKHRHRFENIYEF